MGVKLASKAQFYVKDIFGQIFKFVRNMRENKDNESFLGFVEKSKQCQTNQARARALKLYRTLSQVNCTKSVHNVSKILHPIKYIKHMKPPQKNDS